MTKPAEIAAMIADGGERRSARVDILVNNAGIQHVAPIEEFPIEKWDAIIAINLSSAFHAMRAAMPGMKAAQVGPHHQHRVGAFAGRLAVQGGLCHRQARHRRPDQDRGARSSRPSASPCNCISPGYVWTPLVEKQIPDTMKARNMTEEQVKNDVLLAAQPTKQFVTVEQVAALALYLGSDAAALDHRRQPLDRRRLDRAVMNIRSRAFGRTRRRSTPPTARSASTSRCRAAARTARSPGACSTICCDDGRIEIEGISGTSAGAVNAVMLADGLARGGPEEARKRLADFWRAASRDGDLSDAAARA